MDEDEALAEGGSTLSKVGGLLKSGAGSSATEQPGRANQGESRTTNFAEAVASIRGALRPGAD